LGLQGSCPGLRILALSAKRRLSRCTVPWGIVGLGRLIPLRTWLDVQMTALGSVVPIRTGGGAFARPALLKRFGTWGDDSAELGTVTQVSEHISTGRRVVLGVSAYYHDSAAALVVDGVIAAAAQEERFTRVKGCSELPVRSIEWMLEQTGLGPGDIDTVVFYESPFVKLDRLLSTKLVGRSRALPTFVHSMRTWLPNKLWVQNHLRELLGRTELVYADHHLSHAASAFYPSPFEEAAILTIDGVGEWSTTMISHGRNGKITPITDIEFPNSLGLLYSAFTVFCGFKVNSGEYKLMGLAPYGEPRFVDVIKDRLIHLADDGSFSLNPEMFDYLDTERTYTDAFCELFGAPTRSPEQPLTHLYMDVAASVQKVCDEAVAGLARRAKELTGSRYLCLAGGVALNVVSIGHLERLGLFDEIWVQPAAGDAGGALGAALWASYELLGVERQVVNVDAMRGAFLGPEPDHDGLAITSVVDAYGLTAQLYGADELACKVAEHVAEGRVVAVARGRMEFGPRALGGRSILADARDSATQRRLNIKTKFRESFRPFAPIVLAERASDYFDIDGHESPYMLKTYGVKEDLRLETSDVSGSATFERVNQIRSSIPAVTHLDYSARVQTVDAGRNPFLHDVLAAFDQRTGCAVMVNTSFNVRGEPIVSSSTDAIECFIATDIDVLVLGDYLIDRREQTDAALTGRRASARKED